MLLLLSPAKTLDFETRPVTDVHTRPDFIKHSAELIQTLRALSPAQIGSLMKISDPLAQLNADRYAAWSPRFTVKNAKQAVLAFNGDVYDGLAAASLTSPQLDYTQVHLRILSGLYGLLRPLDLMQPYRLEMGTSLANTRGKNLYAFWDTVVTDALNVSIAQTNSKALINLASAEYFKVVRPALLNASVITPVFEDWKNGQYKVISFFAKRARGMMARYAAIKHIRQPDKLKAFDLGGYAFAEEQSSEVTWVFRRRLEG